MDAGQRTELIKSGVRSARSMIVIVIVIVTAIVILFSRQLAICHVQHALPVITPATLLLSPVFRNI